MRLQLPERAAGRSTVRRRTAGGALLATAVLALAGCSEQTQDEWSRLAMPEPATSQGQHTLDLWIGAWIAAMVTGVIVWGLILYAVVRYRRRSDDEIPVQTRYNLPLEIFYTVAPILMVVVFFAHTLRTQTAVQDEDRVPDLTVEIVGQQWQWTFNYGVGDQDVAANEDATDEEYPYSSYVYEVGTAGYIPTLVLPVDKTVRFNLHSPDVIHDFGVPAFLVKEDVIPGRVNWYQVTPTREGWYAGKCYELCGVSHSRMLFKVHVVSQEEYDAYLADKQASGDESPTPLLGGSNALTQAGLPGSEEDQ